MEKSYDDKKVIVPNPAPLPLPPNDKQNQTCGHICLDYQPLLPLSPEEKEEKSKYLLHDNIVKAIAKMRKFEQKKENKVIKD